MAKAATKKRAATKRTVSAVTVQTVFVCGDVAVQVEDSQLCVDDNYEASNGFEPDWEFCKESVINAFFAMEKAMKAEGWIP